jgi:hypothetical protein
MGLFPVESTGWIKSPELRVFSFRLIFNRKIINLNIEKKEMNQIDLIFLIFLLHSKFFQQLFILINKLR